VQTGTRIGVALILLAMPLPAAAQATGGQGSNQATPMQQAPAGTAAGVVASPLAEREFVAAAAMATRYQIETAEAAIARSGDARLKKFAGMVQADRTLALKELEVAAGQAGIALPPDAALDQTHATKLASLKRRENPAEFDQAYRTDQVQVRQQTLTLLETYRRTGTKEPLRGWADRTLVIERKHLDELNAIR
jgi:predicted outer membrane protein